MNIEPGLIIAYVGVIVLTLVLILNPVSDKIEVVENSDIPDPILDAYLDSIEDHTPGLVERMLENGKRNR